MAAQVNKFLNLIKHKLYVYWWFDSNNNLFCDCYIYIKVVD